MFPGLHGVGTVADVGLGIGGPAFVFHNILTNGHVGGECQQLVPVGNCVLQGDFQSLVVHSLHVQLGIGIDQFIVGVGFPHLVVAVDDFEHVVVVGSQFRTCGTVPCEHEIVGSYGLAIGPGEVVTKLVGVGHSAVLVLFAFRKLLGSIGNDLYAALAVLSVSGQTGEQMNDQCGTVHRGVQSRVNGIRFRCDTHIHAVCTDRCCSGFLTVICRCGGAAGTENDEHCHSKEQCNEFALFHSFSSIFLPALGIESRYSTLL